MNDLDIIMTCIFKTTDVVMEHVQPRHSDGVINLLNYVLNAFINAPKHRHRNQQLKL